MQRLFTMFPLGAAGAGLLVLRLSVAGALLLMVFPHSPVSSSQWALAVAAGLAGILIFGAFTPVLCLACGCLEIAALFTLRGSNSVGTFFALLITVSLGLLGPGGYSLDARMFGRRRVILSTDDHDGL